MKTEKSSENSDFKLLLSIVKQINNAKIFIISFSLLGLVGAICYSTFVVEQPKTTSTFISKGYIDSYVTTDEIIIGLMLSLNDMDVAVKAKKLHLPINIASQLIQVNAQSIAVEKEPDSPHKKFMIGYELAFSSKNLSKQLVNGIMYYIENDEYIKTKTVEWKLRRKVKSDLLISIDKEIQRANRQNDAFNKLEEFALKSNADLYMFKLNTETELINTSHHINDVYSGYPQEIKTEENTNSAILYIFSIIIGAISGFVFYKIIDFFKQVKKQL